MSQLFELASMITAIAVGWGLGRFLRWPSAQVKTSRADNYYQDLSFLFSEQPGPAVLSVIENLPVNESTLPTHLALGNLLRSKGEIEGATRIHQNLLSRPSLPRELLQEVHLELARDYISAGLLDRAERLLRDLLEEASNLRTDALDRLQHIYQSEREWEKAIAVAKQRLPKRVWLNRGRPDAPEIKAVKRAISHYYCELAESELSNSGGRQVEQYLSLALDFDPENIRALLMLCKQQQASQPQRVLKRLDELMCQHPEFVCEALPLYRLAYQAQSGHKNYFAALESLAARIDSSFLHLEIIQQLLDSGLTDKAEAHLQGVLERRPTLNLIAAVPKLKMLNTGALNQAIMEIEVGKPNYRCQHCGFSGRKLHWLCPSCEEWGTIAPIRGKQGD